MKYNFPYKTTKAFPYTASFCCYTWATEKWRVYTTTTGSICSSWGLGCVPASSNSKQLLALRHSMQCWVQLAVNYFFLLVVFMLSYAVFCYTQLLHGFCWSFRMMALMAWQPRLRWFQNSRAHVTRVSSSSWHLFSSCRHLASTSLGVCRCLGRGWLNHKACSTDEIPQVISRTICFSIFNMFSLHWGELQYHISLTWMYQKLKQPVVCSPSSPKLQPLAVHQHKSSCQWESQRPGWIWWNFTPLFSGSDAATRCDATVDGWNPANQLRLVVYPIIYRVSYIPGG